MRRLIGYLSVIMLFVVTGCADSSGSSEEIDGRITVFAAASLTESFTTLGQRFEAKHDGVTVVFNFAGSSTLAQQLIDGAPADVFAAASTDTMDSAIDAEAISSEPHIFVRNVLYIAVPKGNPAGITGLEDFADPDLVIGLCAIEVPCGAAAATVFEKAGITPQPDTYEKDVKAVLTKVRLGELDAALVYRTDILSAVDDVDGIAFDEAATVMNDYPIAVCSNAPNPLAAKAFIDFIRSTASITELEKAGFDTA